LRIAGIIAVLLALLFAGLAINQRMALARMRAALPAPGELIDVAGHAFHLNCLGSGAPTVLIDAGNGSFSLEWTPIQRELSAVARVCTFDRPGYGWSAPGPAPRDGAQVVAELHTALAGNAAPPYILVGHSLGGVHLRLFAAQYPQDVAGMVLIDTPYPLAVTPELEAQMRSSIGFYQAMELLTRSGVLRVLGPLGGAGMLPETAAKLPADLQGVYLELLLDPAQYSTAAAEMAQLPQTFAEADASLSGAQPFGALPLIVLTAGRQPAPGSTPFDAQTVPAAASWLDAGQALAAQSSRGEQRILAASGHLVHLDAPQEVVRAVQDVVMLSRR
jgi:pimeloyl-ACP methyl ester carboxylesterase